MNKKQKWIFRLSILANIVLGILLCLVYTAHSYKLGILKKNTRVGLFTKKDSVYFTLPKGLTVRDVSERGLGAIDLFENNRFEIIVTSDDSLVNYDIPSNKVSSFDNLYSADFSKY